VDIWQTLDQRFPSETRKFQLFAEMYEPLRNAPGCFGEFGVYNGGGARQLARLDPSRTVYAFDTYAGMPQPDYHPTEDYDNPPGKWRPAAGPAELFGGIQNIVPVVGRFADTLPSFPPMAFVLAHIDCDYYESYMQVLDFLLDRMVPGGVALLDDYMQCLGASRAVNEWVAKHPGRIKAELPGFSQRNRITWV
jgi:Macrocin-O-methyltransferase (TylF)